MTRDPAVQNLIDRQAIHDAMMRYSRGVDRGDADLIRSAHHPDAFFDHGSFAGAPEDFVEWLLPFHAEGQISTQHHLTSHSCELDGDTAHTETYFIFNARNRDETVWIAGGRYIDRFERRDGEWKIAMQYCTVEWSGTVNEGTIPFADIWDVHANGVPGRSKCDPSYRRPLTNLRSARSPS